MKTSLQILLCVAGFAGALTRANAQSIQASPMQPVPSTSIEYASEPAPQNAMTESEKADFVARQVQQEQVGSLKNASPDAVQGLNTLHKSLRDLEAEYETKQASGASESELQEMKNRIRGLNAQMMAYQKKHEEEILNEMRKNRQTGTR